MTDCCAILGALNGLYPYDWADMARRVWWGYLAILLSDSVLLTLVQYGNRIKIVMTTKQKTKEQMLSYTVANPNYGEFDGFQITFDGFDKIPSLFLPRGLPGGFRTGKYLLERFKKQFGEFKLMIVKDDESDIISTSKPPLIKLRIGDIRRIIVSFNANYRTEGTKSVDRYLGSLFPDHFPQYSETYRPNSLATVIPKQIEGIQLSDRDKKKYIQLLPALANCDIKSQRDLKRLLAGRKVLHYLHLEKLLNEFERILSKPTKEQTWQAFFKKNLLILNPGYIQLIEKPNISLKIQLPDFILLTVDNYVDVYEIKLPETILLALDKGHKNFYWTAEITKAISQVENYIDSINKYANDLATEIRKSYKLDLSVVRPRGYIIAGHNKEFKDSEKKRDDFRLLNESLKNTSIIPYDDFLARFKNMSKALKEAEA